MSEEAIEESAAAVEPVADTTPNSPPTRSFIAHAKLIGGLTLVSRFMGLGREMVAGHFLGTRMVASAFTLAFTVPNLFRKLFGEGALSAAFIPLYTQAVKHESPAQANAFAAQAVNLLCVILLGITVLGEILLAALIWREPVAQVERLLMLKLTAIMLPYVLLICGTAFLSGILQVHKRFGVPAAAPIILNLCHIGVLLIGAKLLHLQTTTPELLAIKLQTTLAYWLAGFVLVAGVLQLLILLPGLKAVGFTFQPVLRFWTPAIRKMLIMSVPVAVGASVLQVSVLMDKGISWGLMQGVNAQSNEPITHFRAFGHWVRYPMENGATRRLDVAQFLYQFPLGVFAIALATAIFPSLSADVLEKDSQRFRDVLRQGIEASLWEGLPASVGLILVRGPAVHLLFQNGHVTAHDADLIAQSLFYYAGAIWAFSVLQIVNRAYYATHNMLTPLFMSVFNVVLNLVIELPLLWWLGESAMAVGTLVSFALQAVVMLWLLDRKIGGLNLRQSVLPVIKMLLATGVMAIACLAVQRVPGYPHGNAWKAWLIQLIVTIGTGGVVYLSACTVLDINLIGRLRPKRVRATLR